MQRRSIVFSPEARDDLLRLYDYIADNSSPTVALRFVERIEAYCRRFDVASERGRRRDDIRPGLRIVGFERRAVIAFHVGEETVTIDRVLYGGRDLGRALGTTSDEG